MPSLLSSSCSVNTCSLNPVGLPVSPRVTCQLSLTQAACPGSFPPFSLPQKVHNVLKQMQSQWRELVIVMQAAVAEAATQLQQHDAGLQQLQGAQQAQQQAQTVGQEGQEGGWAAQLAAVRAAVEQQGRQVEQLSQVGWMQGWRPRFVHARMLRSSCAAQPTLQHRPGGRRASCSNAFPGVLLRGRWAEASDQAIALLLLHRPMHKQRRRLASWLLRLRQSVHSGSAWRAWCSS